MLLITETHNSINIRFCKTDLKMLAKVLGFGSPVVWSVLAKQRALFSISIKDNAVLLSNLNF